ncbi:uncharacterized protein [Haliotis cracherodii]|uniref:uncharacterized protein n=1 Tax=Haliotis cracherodii TaxID=6455 RepID=UPI0039EAEA24
METQVTPQIVEMQQQVNEEIPAVVQSQQVNEEIPAIAKSQATFTKNPRKIAAVDETKGVQNQSSEESCTVLDKSSSHAAKDNVRAAGRKKTQRSLANRGASKDVKSESGKLEKKQEPAGSEVNSVASGKWTFTALPAQTSTDRRKPAQTGEGCLYELKETSAVTCVDVVDPGKRGQKKQTKKRKLQEESPQPMNSKQRRRLEREARKQKIGVHFYSESNVKNRSYR